MTTVANRRWTRKFEGQPAKPLTVWLPVERHKQLKIRAVQLDTSVCHLVASLVIQWLDDEAKEG